MLYEKISSTNFSFIDYVFVPDRRISCSGPVVELFFVIIVFVVGIIELPVGRHLP